jgi:hypothetical protein
MKDAIRSSVLKVVYCDDYFNIKAKYLVTKTQGTRVHKAFDFAAFADCLLRPLREMYSLSFAIITTNYV